MLTKRTHILFDQSLWEQLVALAKKQNASVGEIVRSTIKEKISQEEKLAQSKIALEQIKKIRPPVSKTPIDYKALINYGRKY